MGAIDNKNLPQVLQIQLKNGVYFLNGELNEYADLVPLSTVTGPIVINFGGVHRINSIGIRNLMRFVSLTTGKKLEYHDCPVALVSQINMIPALLGKKADPRKVRSFYIPFFCETCNLDFEVWKTFDEAIAVLKSDAEMAMPCPQCQKSTVMELDDYFVFLESELK